MPSSWCLFIAIEVWTKTLIYFWFWLRIFLSKRIVHSSLGGRHRMEYSQHHHILYIGETMNDIATFQHCFLKLSCGVVLLIRLSSKRKFNSTNCIQSIFAEIANACQFCYSTPVIFDSSTQNCYLLITFTFCFFLSFITWLSFINAIVYP